MWHPGEDRAGAGGARSSTKARYALVALGMLLAIYLAVNWQASRQESNREKRICELVNGAGNCVRSGGEWVRRGSSPLFEP